MKPEELTDAAHIIIEGILKTAFLNEITGDSEVFFQKNIDKFLKEEVSKHEPYKWTGEYVTSYFQTWLAIR